MIEAFGSTSLVRVGSNYFLNNIGSGAGPELKFGDGTPYAVGQAGTWSPIGVEQTATGYEVAWRAAGADQYSVWATDSNGRYIGNVIGVVSGSSAVWASFETRFQQDLNGNGVIGAAAAAIADSDAMNAGQSAVVLDIYNKGFAADIAHFIGEQESGSWHFNSVFPSGGGGMSEPEGFSLNDAGSRLLTTLLNDVQASSQETTFTTADGTQDTLVNHDSGISAKAFVADLHTSFLIIH